MNADKLHGTVHITVALIGLVRVVDDARDVEHQHNVLDAICARVFEERASRRRLIRNRPELLAAVDHVGQNDVLVVLKASHLAQSMIDGLDVLNELFEQGVVVKVIEGSAAGVHTERSPILDAGREVAELRRLILSRRIKSGLRAARARGIAGGRPRLLDEDKRGAIVIRSERGESIRSIARSLGVSGGTVHNVLANAGGTKRP